MLRHAFVAALTMVVSVSGHAPALAGSSVFGRCVTVVGRVFVDSAVSARYAPGDAVLANVRIYLENGQSVLTDRNGKYAFPCLNPGMHVLRLDTTTLPSGTRPYDVHDNDSSRSVTQLVHGTLDAGMIDTINFAVMGQPRPGSAK